MQNHSTAPKISDRARKRHRDLFLADQVYIHTHANGRYTLHDKPQKRGIRRFIPVIFLALASSTTQAASFNCLFDRHYAVWLEANKTASYEKGITQMSFVGGATTDDTLRLDGSVRATNSQRWTLINSSNIGAAYSGDAGDVLSVLYSRDGAGMYRAALQWADATGYAFTSVGMCDVSRSSTPAPSCRSSENLLPTSRYDKKAIPIPESRRMHQFTTVNES